MEENIADGLIVNVSHFLVTGDSGDDTFSGGAAVHKVINQDGKMSKLLKPEIPERPNPNFLRGNEIRSCLQHLHAGGDENNGVLDIGAVKEELENILSRAASRAAQQKLAIGKDDVPPEGEEDVEEVFEDYEDPFLAKFKWFTQEKLHLVLDNIHLVENHFELFPDVCDGKKCEPVICESLLSVKIIMSKILNCIYYKTPKKSHKTVCFQEPLEVCRGEQALDSQEILLRGRIAFVLRALKCPKLKSFTLINEDDEGAGQNRLIDLENDIVQFLNAHSSTLESISVRSVMPSMTSQSGKDLKPERGISNKNYFKGKTSTSTTAVKEFPNLKELEIIMWQVSGCIIEKTPPKDSYWSSLMSSDIASKELRKVVWSSSHKLFGNHFLFPILKTNRKTLETVHALCTNDAVIDETSRTRFILCSQFQDMENLNNLYLRDFSHPLMLIEVNLLPTSLTQLSLDGITVGSCQLENLVKRLTGLEKLRLVANDSIKKKYKGGQQVAKKVEGFGVDAKVIKAILEHRRLVNVYLWGFHLGQYGSSDVGDLNKRIFRESISSTMDYLKLAFREWIYWMFNPGWKTKVGVPKEKSSRIVKLDDYSIKICTGIDEPLNEVV